MRSLCTECEITADGTKRQIIAAIKKARQEGMSCDVHLCAGAVQLAPCNTPGPLHSLTRSTNHPSSPPHPVKWIGGKLDGETKVYLSHTHNTHHTRNPSTGAIKAGVGLRPTSCPIYLSTISLCALLIGISWCLSQPPLPALYRCMHM